MQSRIFPADGLRDCMYPPPHMTHMYPPPHMTHMYPPPHLRARGRSETACHMRRRIHVSDFDGGFGYQPQKAEGQARHADNIDRHRHVS